MKKNISKRTVDKLVRFILNENKKKSQPAISGCKKEIENIWNLH
jgi:hypothetical protein